ncbi:MAG: copper amine oxidase N-terminal domain-containing protein [Eubacteriales bacterium]|nr:copper amine oxidase N-terminal domain-containing protein [Eubacteriales bacterium]
MKRKIAILLATTMTLSAVPAIAANTNAPAVEGHVTTGISGRELASTVPVLYDVEDVTGSLETQTTTNAEKVQNVKDYKDMLASREGVLKIALNKGNNTVKIRKGTTFDIKLNGASFTDSAQRDLAYVNVSYGAYNGKRADYYGAANDAEDLQHAEAKLVRVEGINESANLVVETGKHDATVANTNVAVTTETITGDLGNFFNSIKPDTGEITGIDNNGASTLNNKTVSPLPHVPYAIEVKDGRTATVTILTDISFENIDKGETKIPSYYKKDDQKFVGGGETEAYIAIPLGGAIIVDGTEDVKVDIIGYNNNAITDGTVTLAKVVGSGSTSINTKLIEKKVFEDKLQEPSDIVIQENIKDSFDENQRITLRLNNGFEFKDYGKYKNPQWNPEGTGPIIRVTDPTNSSSNNVVAENISFAKNSDGSTDYSRIQFNLRMDGFNNASNRNERKSIRIELPGIIPVNEDKNFGEVTLSVYGGGLTEESVVIAERQNLGFKLETKTEVPTITKGRYYAMNDVLSTKGNFTAEFELSELVPNTLLSQRSVDFKVPEGVKIADLDVISMSNMTVDGLSAGNNGSQKTHINNGFEIVNEGSTLRLNRNYFKADGVNKTAKIRLRLKLSVDAGYDKEDITVTVTGGGISQDLSAVVAKAENPFIITAEPKNINIGYQNYSVSDITITETKPGMFMEGENVLISISAPYGTHEMGFTKADISKTGNVEIKPAYGSEYIKRDSNGVNTIQIAIKAQSTKEPASIKLSNVEIGTTRSVPFGAYNLNIGGRAIINNEVMDATEVYITSNKASEGDLLNSMILDRNDIATTSGDQVKVDVKKLAERIDTTNNAYTIQGYVNVVTVVDTIDKEMKVTIGSTTAMIDGKEVTMDVAPYIQANGNTMVPLRFVAVALAGGDASSVEAAQNSDKISWDPVTKTVTIFYGAGTNQKVIQFKIGSTTMKVDGNEIPMENGAKAEIKDGRTFVPFRSLGQALGVPVSWDATTKTAIFNQK